MILQGRIERGLCDGQPVTTGQALASSDKADELSIVLAVCCTAVLIAGFAGFIYMRRKTEPVQPVEDGPVDANRYAWRQALGLGDFAV